MTKETGLKKREKSRFKTYKN